MNHRKLTFTCADPEVRHSNTEESVFYFLRRNQNHILTPLLILQYVARSAYVLCLYPSFDSITFNLIYIIGFGFFQWETTDRNGFDFERKF